MVLNRKDRRKIIRKLIYVNFSFNQIQDAPIRKACLWFWYRGLHHIQSRLRSRPSHNDLL